ncbi:MAG: nitric oxide-sensing transcriptional repressor NsrR [Amphiplicatus sp.]|jgi:Rrf2 family nitric oxide-sensitive transcriptional repressor
MRLTLFTDYALRVLMYLGLKRDELATIREIAAHYRISENHLMKVVHQLGKDGFVTTVRGRQGGLALARAPKDIKIGDVVRRYEDDLRLVECFDRKTNTCPIAGACALTGVFNDALAAFLKTLDRKTLADVLKSSPAIGARLGLSQSA